MDASTIDQLNQSEDVPASHQFFDFNFNNPTTPAQSTDVNQSPTAPDRPSDDEIDEKIQNMDQEETNWKGVMKGMGYDLPANLTSNPNPSDPSGEMEDQLIHGAASTGKSIWDKAPDFVKKGVKGVGELIYNITRPLQAVEYAIKGRLQDINAQGTIDRLPDESWPDYIARAAEQATQDNINQLKTAPNTTIKNIYDDFLTQSAQDFDNAKAGFLAPHSERVGARDLMNVAFGKENVDSVDTALKQKFQYSTIGGDLLQGTPLEGGEFQNIINDSPPGVLANLATNSVKFALRHLVPITSLAADIYMDPLTHGAMGAVNEVAANSFTIASKGAMAGLAKMSPEVADKLSDIIDNSANIIKKTWGTYINPATEVERVAANMGKSSDEAEDTIMNINEALLKAKTEHSEAMEAFRDNYPTQKMGAIRKMFAKVADKAGYTPTGTIGRYMIGMDNATQVQQMTFNALKDIESNLSSSMQAGMADETGEMLSHLLTEPTDAPVGFEPIDQDHADWVKTSVQQVMKSSAPSGGEIVQQEGQTLDQAINQQARVGMMRQFDEQGVGTAKDIASKIADIRYGRRMTELGQRAEVMRQSYQEAQRSAAQIIKDAQSKIGDIQDEEKGIFDQTFSDRKEVLLQERDGLLEGLDDGEARDYLRGAYRDKIQEAQDSLKSDMQDRIDARTQDVHADTASKTSDVMNGLPDNDDIQDLQSRAADYFGNLRDKEVDFFHRNLMRANFMDTWNQVLQKKAAIHADIFDDGISDLPPIAQRLARDTRDLFQYHTQVDQAIDKDYLPIPGYLPRRAMTDKMGIINTNPDDFESYLFGKQNNGSGLGTYSKERVAKDWDDFKNMVAPKGKTAIDDLFHLIVQRDVETRLNSAKFNILNMIPDEYKTGEGSAAIKRYVDFIWNGNKYTDNPWEQLKTNAYSQLQMMNKMFLTTPFPKFWIKHALMGPPLLMAQYDGLSHINPVNIMDNWATALALKTGNLDKLSNGVEDITSQEFMDAMKQYGLGATSFTRNIGETSDVLLNRYSKMDPRHWVTSALHYSQEVEDLKKIYSMLSFWNQGRTLKDAARMAKEATFDYSRFSYPDRTLSGIMGFYGFMRKNFPATIKGMVEHPEVYSTLSNLVDDFSTGKAPTDEQLDDMSEWDKNKLHLWGDYVKGHQAGYELGFFPVEEFYNTAHHIINGDWEKILTDTVANNLPGYTKSFLKELSKGLYRNTPMVQEMVNSPYQYLPREYSDMTDSQVKLLNDFTKWTGWGNVQARDRVFYDNGKAVQEKGILVPGSLYSWIAEMPTARILKGSAGLVKQYMADTGNGPADATAGNLLKGGYFGDAGDMIKYITGLNQKDFDWKMMALQRKTEDHGQVEGMMAARKLLYMKGIVPKWVKQKMYNSQAQDEEPTPDTSAPPTHSAKPQATILPMYHPAKKRSHHAIGEVDTRRNHHKRASGDNND